MQPAASAPSEIVLEQERLQLQKDAVEREQAIKKWSLQHMKDNYADFERLLGAKLAEILARVEALAHRDSPPIAAASAPAGGSGPAVDTRKYDDWIAFHEPKINLLQKGV